MKNLICIVFLLTSLFSFAQPEDAQIEVVNGKRYYVHMVQGGNTLYGIHRLYNVSVEAIVAANPESVNGLSEGQRILVPIKGVGSLPENLVIHTVVAKETLYGISKKYETTVERLVEMNPGIENGLNVGQDIKVPFKLPVGKVTTKSDTTKKLMITFTDSLIEHEVMKGETLYSISKRFMVPTEELKKINEMRNDRLRPGDIIKIPIKKENIEKVPVRKIVDVSELKHLNDSIQIHEMLNDSVFLFKKKESYNVVIMMPLFLDRGEGFNVGISNLAAEYYMGTKFALDSLKALGLKAKVYVHDSKNDSTSVMDVLEKPEFADVDLLIGPFFGSNAEYVAKWSKEHGVRMICPVATNYEILRNNPFIYESVTSDVTLINKLAKHIVASHGDEQIILVKPHSDKDQLLSNSFRTAVNQLDLDKDSLPKIIETTPEDFTTFINNSKGNQIVFLSSDKSEVSLFMANLSRNMIDVEKPNVSIYGTKDWENFSSLEEESLVKFDILFVTPFDLNYKNERTINFNKNYKRVYRTQVSKMALQGYDVTMFFCQSLLMGKTPRKGIMNNIQLEQIGEGGGYENTNCILVKRNNYSFLKFKELND